MHRSRPIIINDNEIILTLKLEEYHYAFYIHDNVIILRNQPITQTRCHRNFHYGFTHKGFCFELLPVSKLRTDNTSGLGKDRVVVFPLPRFS